MCVCGALSGRAGRGHEISGLRQTQEHLPGMATIRSVRFSRDCSLGVCPNEARLRPSSGLGPHSSSLGTKNQLPEAHFPNGTLKRGHHPGAASERASEGDGVLPPRVGAGRRAGVGEGRSVPRGRDYIRETGSFRPVVAFPERRFRWRRQQRQWWFRVSLSPRCRGPGPQVGWPAPRRPSAPSLLPDRGAARAGQQRCTGQGRGRAPLGP